MEIIRGFFYAIQRNLQRLAEIYPKELAVQWRLTITPKEITIDIQDYEGHWSNYQIFKGSDGTPINDAIDYINNLLK